MGTQFLVVLLALLTSIGVAGIPAASLVAIAIILGAVGLPLEGIGLILAVDRILDMLRTAVNVFSDSCGAVIIARSEGETGVLSSDDRRPPRRSGAGRDVIDLHCHLLPGIDDGAGGPGDDPGDGADRRSPTASP